MNAWIRRSLASGTGLALTLCGGAWAVAQSQSSATQNQAAPAQSQQSPAAQTSTPGAQTAPAQQQTAPTQQQTAPPAQPQTRTLQMVEVKAELQKSLDAKKAKEGEPVTAKLQDDANIPNAQTLPKNTILEGHIDQTQVSPDKNGTSSVTVTFDKAKLKSGEELPIKATVVAIAQPQNNTAAAGGAGAPVGGPGGGGAPSGGAPAGAGAPGGAGQGTAGGSEPAPSSSIPSQQEPTAGGPGYGGNQGGGAVGNVQLKSDIHQQSSATFLQNGKNVHIPDGTLMEVAVTVIPPGTRLQ